MLHLLYGMCKSRRYYFVRFLLPFQYRIAADESTTINYGQRDLQATYSREYRRLSLLIDGDSGFFTYVNGASFCYTTIASS